ncbi:MAG: hypothetical protein ACON4R_05555 [Akkermansiaceae bacterium]
MVRSIALFLLIAFPLKGREGWLTASVPNSPPANQLQTDGNACGPACLLDAFRSGGEKWRSSIARIKGTTDTARIRAIILGAGRRPSRLDPTKTRWSKRAGVNAIDLADMANELRGERWMRTVKSSVFFKKERETQSDLLRRTHKQLASALKRELPPILLLRRVAFRSPQGSIQKSWLTIKGHFVVLTGLPTKLPRGTTSFPITYHDPWGGYQYKGTIRITDQQTSGLPTLVADFPKSKIGRDLVRKNEPTCLSLSSAVGLF